MVIGYVISLFYLVIMFMLYRKRDNKLCLISSIVYTLALLFCYNTFVVYFLYLFGVDGSILLYSIINYFIGTIIGVIIILKDKKIQKYYFDKKKFIVFLIVGILIFLVGSFRHRWFNAIGFASGDSGIHYGHTLRFSQELSILDINNTKNDVEGYYVRVMPISYINGGLLFNIFSSIKPYVVFLWYNVGCLTLSGLVFLVTLFEVFKHKKNNYLYYIIFSLFYVLAFPLNNFIMGFCYLSLSIMVINLLYLSIYKFRDNFDKDVLFKLLVIFLITFSCFYSYYLFVPVIYLSLGLYYIYLWKKKNINFIQMILYGILTLILPFIIGFLYFFVTLFQDYGVGIVTKTLNTNGFCYVSITTLFMFVLGTIYLFCYKVKKKNINFIIFSLIILTIYIFIFMILFIIDKTEVYYLFKLFSLYWLFLLLVLFNDLINYRKILYFVGVCLFVINIYVYLFPLSDISSLLVNLNIYSYNARHYSNRGLIYESEELDMLENSVKFNDVCLDNRHFLILGGNVKHIWGYFITGNIPVVGKPIGHINYLFENKLKKFEEWEENDDYSCLIYYYEGKDVSIDKEKYDILYENDKGVIIKKKNIS